MTQCVVSVWDLHKEIQNLTSNDPLRPRNDDKGPQWLGRRIKELPKPCDIAMMAYKLRQLEYRALWRDMAKEHQRVVLALIDASNAEIDQEYDHLFNQATGEMVSFLDHFATRAAPFSRTIDNQFEILMDNFGTVIDTVCIFYDRFDCEGRSETLKLERDEKRMAFFCFEKNERQPRMDLSEGWKAFGEVYGPPIIDAGMCSPSVGQFVRDFWADYYDA